MVTPDALFTLFGTSAHILLLIIFFIFLLFVFIIFIHFFHLSPIMFAFYYFIFICFVSRAYNLIQLNGSFYLSVA